MIFKIASSYSQNQEERKDLMQDIILQLWKAFPNYDSRYGLSTWIYRIALNVSISFYRKEKTRKKTARGYQQSLEISEQNPKQTDRLEQLYRWIDTLNPLEKAVMILYLEGNSQKEMAVILGTSATNISTRINRIKNKLSQNYQTENN